MATERLNILPVPTFASLGVNWAERSVEMYETETIALNAGDEQTVIRYADANTYPFRNLYISLGAGAKMKLVQVFDRADRCVSRLNVSLDESAELELVQVYIGGGDTVSEIVARLDGAGSRFKAVIGCALDGDDSLDIDLIAEHRGRKSLSEINAASVLSGSSNKIFKGTIDFKNGSSGAKGSEHENALLLGNRVRNRTVPVILCDEENVEGNHGATIGRLDEKHIFYMRSRGMSEDKIYELMARSKLMQAIGRVGDREVKARIYNSLGWGDTDE